MSDESTFTNERPMPLADMLELLGGHPFLRGMTRRHIEVLADCAMPRNFEADEMIFREGDPANRFYLIREGKVALEHEGSGRPSLVQFIGGGDVLGWSWLFPPYQWHFSARAVEPTRAIFLYGTRVRERCDHDHDLGYDLMRRMTEVIIARLQATRLKIRKDIP